MSKNKPWDQITRGALVMLLLIGGSPIARAQGPAVRQIKIDPAHVPQIVIVRNTGGTPLRFPKLDAASKDAIPLTMEDKLNSLRSANITGSPRGPVRLSVAKPYQDIFDRDQTGRDALQMHAYLLFQNPNFVVAQSSDSGSAGFAPQNSFYQGSGSDKVLLLWLNPVTMGKRYLIDFCVYGDDFLLSAGNTQQKISHTSHVLLVYDASDRGILTVALTDSSPLGPRGEQWVFFYCEITPLS